jgi:uncharacterized membrane protein YeaQ/YmgE (transglycosylase-associated protein family)
MGIILWLVIGGIVGWLASKIMKTDAQQGVLANILIGILGAFLGSQLLGGYSINAGISIRSIVISLFGAVVLLGLINLIRRGRVR